jgi:hypothetical protein
MIHITGFEEFAGEQSPASALARADYITTGTLALVAGRFSSGITTQNGMLSRKMPWTTDRFSTGFAHQFSDRGSVASLKIGDTALVLWMNPDNGMPMVNDQMGGALPTKNRWYYFEMEITRPGQVTVFINGRQEMTFALAAALAAQEVEVGLGYVAPSSYRPGVTPVPVDSASKTYDDWYMRDDARLGPISVTTRFPNQDAHVEWFNTDAGKSSHANTVSLHPPIPLDHYVASAVIGAEDRFKSIQPLASNNAVVATGIVVMARKSPTFDAKLGVFIGGNAEDRAGARTVGADWKTQYVCFEAVASDTPDKITTSEFGFNVTAP